MKTYLLPLSLRLARAAVRPAVLSLPLLALTGAARAQDAGGAPRILFPQPNQDVRGEIALRFEGLPAGGYAIVKLNGKFKTGTSETSYVLDTIGDRASFPDDGPYTIEITALNAGGRVVGTSSVTFNVANSKVANEGQAVPLVHWTLQDRMNDGVQRYRVFAESNADISGGGASGASGGSSPGGSSGGGGGDSGTQYLPTPLDWQVGLLLRRQVRDVYGFEGAANIATAVSQAQQRQRLQTASASGKTSGRKKKAAGPPVKGPWSTVWSDGPELGKYYVKAIKPTGDEINATRKVTSIALADLLPTFPTVAVRPGSTWQSRQSFLSDLSTRDAIDTQGAITFTSYDTIQTPSGESRRCAKLESRFPLPDNVAKRIAAGLGSKVGSGGAGGSGGGPSAGPSPIGSSGASGGGADALTPEDIDVANFSIARVIWFDMDRHQVVRSEDTMNGYFEVPPAASGDAGGGAAMGGAAMGGPSPAGAPGGEGGGGAAAEEPTKVTYNMNVTTWLDDRIPSPSIPFNGGAGTAHSRDNVKDVGLTRVTGGR